MAKFFVGQRVKLVRPYNPERFGWTGRIREFDILYCYVDWDNGLRDGENHDAITDMDSIEPILPEGQQPVSIEKMLREDELKELAHVFGREVANEH